MRDLTSRDAFEFIQYFSANFPDLCRKISPYLTTVVMNGSFGFVTKPKTVSDEDFGEFRSIEWNWLIDNKFIEQTKGWSIFPTVEKGFARYPNDHVLGLSRIDETITRVKLLTQTGTAIEIDLKADYECVRHSIAK